MVKVSGVRRLASCFAHALAAALWAAASLAAQRPVPTITLDKGAKEAVEPFSQVSGMFELRDGRVLIVDSQEKEIRFVDFAKGTVAVALKSGPGPLEFQMGMLLGAIGDSAVLYDYSQRRLLLFAPDGRPVRSVLLGGTDPMAFLSTMRPTHVDGAGRAYGESEAMRMPMPRAGQPMPSAVTFDDTVAIQRFDLRTGKTDSVARIRHMMAQLEPKMEISPAGAVKMSVTAPNFDAADVWTVTQDGTVLALRDGDYRVRFISQGRERLGPPVPHLVIPITRAMQRATMDSIRAQMRVMNERPQRGGGTPAPKSEFDVREPTRWAASMSPYRSIRTSRDGHIWVGTPDAATPMDDRTARFDVLDATGVLIARVTVATGERIAGFGRGAVYTVRTDADDLQYLRRYTIAVSPKP
jgi:hypothetical protein